MKLLRIIGLILVLSPLGQAFGVDQTILDRLHANDQSITRIGLGNHQIEDTGACALAEALRTNTCLTELYLHENQIGAEGARALAGALRTNTSLTRLDLNENQIGDELEQEIARLMSPDVLYHERRALVPWSRPRHLRLASWNPQVAPVVTTILLLEVRSRTQALSAIDAQGRIIRLPHLPTEMWHKILGYLRCGAFGPLALPVP